MKSILVLFSFFIHLSLLGETRTIHTFVALCDNENQGIVPVPEFLGNGQDPKTNLYWGAAYGLKTFFKNKTDEWNLVKSIPSENPYILERLLFKHKDSNIYMLAEAFDGAHMKACLETFLKASNGQNKLQLKHNDQLLYFGGGAHLVAFLGHNGLMDFNVKINYQESQHPKDVIILACYSKDYFSPEMRKANAKPILWSTHLMAPEAYTYKAALDSWIKGQSLAEIEESASQMYNHYQKCGIKGARALLTSGF